MSTRRPCFLLGVALLSAWCQARAQGAAPAAEPPDWWRAERDVVARQMAQGGAFAKLVAEATAPGPKTPQEELFGLSVLMRAGMDEAAAECVRRLREKAPDLDAQQVAGIYYSACDRYGAWASAQSLVESYAATVTDISVENRLVRNMLEAGWGAEKVDRWLAGLTPPPSGDRPARSDRWFFGRRVTPAEFWFQVRLRFDLDHGLGGARLAEFAAAARARPDETWRAMDLLTALERADPETQAGMDLAWLPEAVRPKRATEACDLAEALGQVGRWDLALGYAQFAATTPLTAEEVGWMGEMVSVPMRPETLRAAFEATAADTAAKCLLTLDRQSEAQRWMVKADDIRRTHNLGRNALFAGQVQAATEERVIEGRIRQEEEKSKDAPDYWLERAQYYRGRGEPAQEEAALKQALTLVKPKPEPEHPVHWSDRRSQVVASYVNFLEREARRPEAVAMLRKEVAENPDAASAKRAVHSLAYDFEKEIESDDPVLWGWLEKRPKWDYTEERLIWRLLENAPPDSREKCLLRAEGLAAGADPSRALELGWVLTRLGAGLDARAVPHLRDALARAGADAELTRSATLTLFEAYLNSGDWKGAEALYPDVAKHLGPGEVEEWYARVALCAAHAKAGGEAMRLWASVANLCPAELGYLDQMADAGLREDLVAFYKKMEKTLPASQVPARALKELRRRR